LATLRAHPHLAGDRADANRPDRRARPARPDDGHRLDAVVRAKPHAARRLQGYLDAASKATGPDALFPHISKEYKTLLQKAPKDRVEKMLKMSIAKEKLQDNSVTSQQVGASKAVLKLTAKTGDGRPTTGKVTMVKEGRAWKLDEDAWATPLKQ
jgi:hypothetical protein